MWNFINFYFEFEYRNHRTIKRDVKLQFGDAIVSRLEANKQTLDTMHNLALNLKNTVGVGRSDRHRKCLAPSDKGFSAKLFLTGRKFRPCIGSFDNHITSTTTASFGGSGIYNPSPLSLAATDSFHETHSLELPKLLPTPSKS